MTPFLLILAVCLQLQGIFGQTPGIWTQQPPIKPVCYEESFVASTAVGSKVFLLPWKQSDRIGDWYQARGYCAQHCAEIAIVQSAAELILLNEFISSSFDLTGDLYSNSYWLGGQTVNGTFTTWSNGLPATYLPEESGEFSPYLTGLLCTHVFLPSELEIWTDYCYNQLAIVCQRPALWTPCYNAVCNNGL